MQSAAATVGAISTQTVDSCSFGKLSALHTDFMLSKVSEFDEGENRTTPLGFRVFGLCFWVPP